MNDAGLRPRRLEELLASVLRYGTWLACFTIAAGFLLAFTLTGSRGGVRAIGVGIVFFILLPVLRVLLMLLYFVRQRDYGFGAIAGVVLLVIGLGCALGAIER